MDGLISSLQYSSNRHSSFSYTEKSDEDKNKGNKNPSNQTSSSDKTPTSSSTLGNYTVSQREDTHDGKGGGNGGFHSSQHNKVTNTSSLGNKFGTTLGDAIASAAIVDAALKVVQGVRDNMLEEFKKTFGFPTDNHPSTTLPQRPQGNTQISMGSMNLEFNSVIVSGNTSQMVSVNVAISQTMIQQNMPNLFEFLGIGSRDQQVEFETADVWYNRMQAIMGLSVMVDTSSSSNVSLSATNVQINMSMVQVEGGGVQLRPTFSLKDPLMIDLGGDGIELSNDLFEFDIDSDGESDQISRPKGNSGFLALDKNNDGIINNGNELFGTKSGNGFKDLAVYDSNNDGKIDKNDPIFDKLRIWKPDAQGKGQLIGLGEVGIGAIYLNAQSNEKVFENASGDLLGVQRQSAAYERTDGTLGGIHHVDLAAYQKNKDTAEDTSSTNKAKGLASYRYSQGELDRLRFLNNQPTSQSTESELKPYYEQMNSLLGQTGFLNTNKDKIAQKIENIKKGNISEEDLAMIQLDMLMSKNPKTSFVSLLDNAVFGGELGKLNSSVFEYAALLNAQRLLR